MSTIAEISADAASDCAAAEPGDTITGWTNSGSPRITYRVRDNGTLERLERRQ